MQVKTINDKKGIKSFVAFADSIYKGDANYVPFMKKDLTKTLETLVLKEKSYTALMVFGEDGAPQGRILFTVGVNKQLPDKARCGYFFLFECVNSQEAANALLAEMNRRLAATGVEYVEGAYWPFDPDNRRGILVKGFEFQPVIFTSYNPEYYPELLENFGFEKHFDTLTFKMEPNEKQIERHTRVSEYAKKRYGYRVDKMNPSQIDRDIKDVQQIMAEAATEIIYQDAPSVDEIRHIVSQWKNFLDPDFILIARTNAGRPVGAVMAIPDYFQVFKAMKGKTTLPSLLKFIKARKKIDAVRAMLLFVVPDFQGKGVNVSLYTELLASARKKGIRLIEAGTMMENNTHPIEALKTAGGELFKVYRIYYMKTGGVLMNADFLLFATDAAQPNLILTVVALLAVFGLPCLMILLTRKVKFFKIVGAVALCYVLGFAFSLSGLNYDKSLVETVASVLVCIAIPLVLFGFEMKSLKRLAKKTAVSFGLVCVSAVVVATAAFLITKNFLPDAAGLTAMSIGLYIGGTPNLLAIGSAMLGTGHEAIVLANTADLFVGGLYFLFLLTAAKPVYSFVLDGKKRKKQKASDENTTENKVSVETATENSDVSSDGSARQDANGEISPDDKRLLSVANEYDFSVVERNKKSIWRLVGVVALAVACFGVGVGLELLVNGSLAGSLFILVTVSVLGIAFSFVKPVRETKGSYQVGQYLILSFSLALSMSMDMSKLVSELLPVLLLFACLQIGGILLHLILCKIFKIDSDTALITSTAGVYGPPFITPVANAAKRNDLIAPGIICATLGLAIGNFIGIGVGQLFLLLM